jgi:hypothetical protein
LSSSAASQESPGAVAIAEPPHVAVPVPDASIEPVATMDDALRRQYRALVKELGLVQPGLLKDEALAYFRERGTRIYDKAKVAAFLTDQYGSEKVLTSDEQRNWGIATLATWGWRGLRRADAIHSESWGGNPHTNGRMIAGQYTKPVPLPVLLTVKDVSARFPDAHFYVSDDVTTGDLRRGDDPFLLVIIERTNFIIERWDEPTYRE